MLLNSFLLVQTPIELSYTTIKALIGVKINQYHFGALTLFVMACPICAQRLSGWGKKTTSAMA